ncbi:MAG: helix-turn-helix domain-containing protein [Planctomycetes bacterium]|nr:helix-turn-helix domain-containing protein [Planctomycetota bacterium]
MTRLTDRTWGGANWPSAVASQPTTAPLLLDAHEAARALRLSERTLWAMTKAGTLPCVKIGKRNLYSPAHLQAWIDRRASGINAPAEKSQDSS